MKGTWEIGCDQPMLEMIAFSVGVMRDMLQENLDSGGKCECGAKSSSLPQLRRDIKTADKILAAIYKGQVNLEVMTEVKRKTDIRLERSRPRPRHSRGRSTKK